MKRLRRLVPMAWLAAAVTLALFASQCGGDEGGGGPSSSSGDPPGQATGTVRLSVRGVR